MASPDPRKLKDAAAVYVSRGKWAKALDNYLQLEKLEPRDGTWAQRSGDMQRRLGRSADAMAAWTRASDVYSANGFLLKAIAVCKLILEIDPSSTAAEKKLAGLHSARMIARPPRMATIVAAAVPPASPSMQHAAAKVTEAEAPAPGSAPLTRSDEFDVAPRTIAGPPPIRLPAGAPLEQVELKTAVPGAHKSEELPAVGDACAYEIPLGDEDGYEIEIVEERDTAADTARSVFPRTPLFSALDEQRLRTLISRVGLKQLAPGEVLFKKGDPADGLYVIASGEVAVLSPGAGGAEIEVSRLREGAFFGEIAILTGQPRNAKIQATVETELLIVYRDDLMEIIADSPEVLQILLRFMRDRLLENLVETNALFAPFSGADRRALASRFRFVEAEPGIAVLVEGQKAKGLFILLAGDAEIRLEGKPLGLMAQGSLVGETSLLRGAPALAGVVAKSKLLLLVMPRADFQDLIMTHPQVLEYIGALAEDRGRQLDELKKGTYAEGRVRVV